MSPDRTRWISSHPKFFLPVNVLAEVFRGKFHETLREAFAQGQLGFHGNLKSLGQPKAFSSLLRQSFRKKWVVYAKRPFGGAEHALRYLGCYTHRVAISNHRLVSFADGKVTFRWRDSRHQNKKRLMTLHVHEFLRRFLLHVLPRGFVRIRHFGFLSTRNRSTLLPICRSLLPVPKSESRLRVDKQPTQARPATWICPYCSGPMVILERFTAAQLLLRSPPHFTTATA